MEITQVKCLKDGTTIRYSEINVDTTEFTELPKCPDKRHDDFEKALVAVGDLGSKILAQKKARWSATGVSVSKNPLGNRSFVITGMLQTNAGKVALNTPVMREPVDNELGDSTFKYTEVETVDGLLACAVDYVRGEREQLKLPLEGEAGTGEGSEPVDEPAEEPAAV